MKIVCLMLGTLFFATGLLAQEAGPAPGAALTDAEQSEIWQLQARVNEIAQKKSDLEKQVSDLKGQQAAIQSLLNAASKAAITAHGHEGCKIQADPKPKSPAMLALTIVCPEEKPAPAKK